MHNKKKIIYVNLWYDMYFEKTNAMLKSFRRLGYETHVMTVTTRDALLVCKIVDISSDNNEILSFSINKAHGWGYFSVFKSLFSYVVKEEYEIVYIRRLMSKLIFAALYLKRASKKINIVYEIPTYPFDKAYSPLIYIRNFVETRIFNNISKMLSLITTVLIDNINIPESWLAIQNGIDIDRYPCPGNVPDFSDTIYLLAISNMAKSHCYERLLYAIKDYSGRYKIKFTMISKNTQTYMSIQELAEKLDITNNVTFLPEMTIDNIISVAKKYHIGIGMLTYGEKNRTTGSPLKNKDYCAIGIPFISTSNDSSFPDLFPYHYIISNDTYDIDLNKIIDWYIDIRKDKEYKVKMYNYAKEHLQYDNTAKEIISRLGL